MTAEFGAEMRARLEADNRNAHGTATVPCAECGSWVTIYPPEDGTHGRWVCGLCGKNATAVGSESTILRRSAPYISEILDTFFGRPAPDLGPFVENGRVGVRWADEASLRKGLAVVAAAHGWTVEQEVVVPGWGRIDIVLRDPGVGTVSIVELKLELTKPAKIRRAFQQADGYGRWWASNRGSPADTYLIGATEDAALVSATADLYPSVRHLKLGTFLGTLEAWGNREMRSRIARSRRDALLTQVAIHDAAIAALNQQLPP